jgi:hypothetical protein
MRLSEDRRTRMTRASGGRWAAAVLLAGLMAQGRARGSQDAGEYDLKAAWLFNFASHVEWPAAAFKDAGSPITICILGKDPFGGRLAGAFRDKKANGRALGVRVVATADEAKDAQIVYVPDAEMDRMKEVSEKLGAGPVLVVAESEGAALRGATLNFFMEGGKVRFEANLKSAARRGLSVGTKLLKFARIVEGGRP